MLCIFIYPPSKPRHSLTKQISLRLQGLPEKTQIPPLSGAPLRFLQLFLGPTNRVVFLKTCVKTPTALERYPHSLNTGPNYSKPRQKSRKPSLSSGLPRTFGSVTWIQYLWWLNRITHDQLKGTGFDPQWPWSTCRHRLAGCPYLPSLPSC